MEKNRLNLQLGEHFTDCKVASRSISRLIANRRIFRLFMKGKFDTKVQVISEGFVVSSIFSKKQTKTCRIVVKTN